MRSLQTLVCVLSGITLACTAPASEVRKAAPDFTLNDAKGSPVTLSKYKGKVVLLDFWSTWCGGCQVEVPWFVEFSTKYKQRGLVIIAASMDDDGWKSVKPFVTETKINYPVVIATPELADRYGVEAMPMTLLIDRDGRIAFSHVGLIDKNVFESEIRALLDEK